MKIFRWVLIYILIPLIALALIVLSFIKSSEWTICGNNVSLGQEKTLLPCLFYPALTLILGILLWHLRSWLWDLLRNKCTPIWKCIGRNYRQLTLFVALFTGVSLVVFSCLSWNMSKRLVELEYSPIPRIFSTGAPFSSIATIGNNTFQGVKWELVLLNPGQVQLTITAAWVAVKQELLGFDQPSNEDTFVIRPFVERFIDDQGDNRDLIVVNASESIRLGVFLCDTKDYLYPPMGDSGYPVGVRHGNLTVEEKGVLYLALHSWGGVAKTPISVRNASQEFVVSQDFDTIVLFFEPE